MGAQAAQVPEAPAGLPAVRTAGSVVELDLFIPGEPVPQDRPRGRVRTGPKGSFVQFYEIQQCREYKEHVAEVAHHQATQTPVLELAGGGDFTLPLDKHRVVVVMRFNLTKPPSYPKRVVEHTKRPDADNLAKGVLDGLVQGRLLKDDGCVTDLTSYKRYAEPGHPPGVEIQLLAIPAEMA